MYEDEREKRVYYPPRIGEECGRKRYRLYVKLPEDYPTEEVLGTISFDYLNFCEDNTATSTLTLHHLTISSTPFP